MIKNIEDWLAISITRVLSRAGRFTLVKTVLNKLHMYYLSLFKMPGKVFLKIIRIQNRFFWAVVCELVEQCPKTKTTWELGVGDLKIKTQAFCLDGGGDNLLKA